VNSNTTIRERGLSSDGMRIGGGRPAVDRDSIGTLGDGVAPLGFRARIPSPAQLLSLLKDGVLQLPARYFRGYFLDVLV
jgi:hypothetical protein